MNNRAFILKNVFIDYIRAFLGQNPLSMFKILHHENRNWTEFVFGKSPSPLEWEYFVQKAGTPK